MQWFSLAVGVFYASAGVVVLRRMAMDRLLDLALQAITLEDTAAKERIRSRVLTFGGCLTLAGGLALATLSPWATVLFAANSVLQGGYLLWAWKTLPPESEDEQKGRQQTINAFVIYLAAFAFVVHAHSQGVLSHWPVDVGGLSRLIEPLVIGAITAGVWASWFLQMPRSGKSSAWNLADGSGADSWNELPKPTLPDRLRLAPEYGCWPTWDDETGYNIDPADLGLSEGLLARLQQWDDAWQATFKPDDPHTSWFADDAAAQHWREEGRVIAAELEREWPGPVVVKI